MVILMLNNHCNNHKIRIILSPNKAATHIMRTIIMFNLNQLHTELQRVMVMAMVRLRLHSVQSQPPL
ncbi:hypothetical protein J1N35_020219, partial [Gossypium stocksii]